MILKWNILHRVDSHIKHPNSYYLRSHSRAMMALDHRRLDLENKFLENKLGQSFCFRQNLLHKILPTNSGVCKPTVYTFYPITSEVKQYCLSYRPRTECSISQFFKTNCTQSIFRTINCGLLAKPFKKFPKSPIRPASSHFWWAPNLQWTLIELRFNIKNNLLCLFFYLRVL